jgi:hypothetical protein
MPRATTALPGPSSAAGSMAARGSGVPLDLAPAQASTADAPQGQPGPRGLGGSGRLARAGPALCAAAGRSFPTVPHATAPAHARVSGTARAESRGPPRHAAKPGLDRCAVSAAGPPAVPTRCPAFVPSGRPGTPRACALCDRAPGWSRRPGPWCAASGSRGKAPSRPALDRRRARARHRRSLDGRAWPARRLGHRPEGSSPARRSPDRRASRAQRGRARARAGARTSPAS